MLVIFGEGGLDGYNPGMPDSTNKNLLAEENRKLHAENRRLRLQFELLKKTILEQFPGETIDPEKTTLEDLVTYVRGIGAKAFDQD